MSAHVIVVTEVPVPADEPDAEPEFEYAVECPGVTDDCRTWWEQSYLPGGVVVACHATGLLLAIRQLARPCADHPEFDPAWREVLFEATR